MPIDYTLSSAAKSISLSYDGKLLACSSSSVPTTVTVFNVSDGVMVAKLTAAPGHVFGQVAFLPDQSLAIVANRKDGVPNEIVQVKLDDTIVHRIPISTFFSSIAHQPFLRVVTACLRQAHQLNRLRAPAPRRGGGGATLD